MDRKARITEGTERVARPGAEMGDPVTTERQSQFAREQFALIRRIAARSGRALGPMPPDEDDDIPEDEEPRDDSGDDEPVDGGWVRDVLDLREVDRSEWDTIRDVRPGGDGYKLEDHGEAWDEHRVLLAGRAGWISNFGKDFGLDKMTWADIEFGPHEGESAHWMIRAYGLRDTLIERVWCHDMRQEFRDGHSVYVDLAGSMTVRDCLFENLGGQALQFTNRQWREPPLHRETVGGEVHVDRVVILDTGQGDGRGSWPISINGIGAPNAQFLIDLDQVYIDNSWSEPNSKGARSHGGILVESGLVKHVYSSVSVHETEVRTVDSDRGLLTVNGAEELNVTHSGFWARGGKNRITLDRTDFGFGKVEPIRRAEFVHNRGNCEVWSRGKKVAMCNEDFVLENGVRVR